MPRTAALVFAVAAVIAAGAFAFSVLRSPRPAPGAGGPPDAPDLEVLERRLAHLERRCSRLNSAGASPRAVDERSAACGHWSAAPPPSAATEGTEPMGAAVASTPRSEVDPASLRSLSDDDSWPGADRGEDGERRSRSLLA